MAAVAVGAPAVPGTLPFFLHLFCLVAFAFVGGLFLLDRRHQAALHVGGVSLLLASAFAWRPLARLGRTDAPGHSIATVLGALPLEAFVPLLLWLLVRERRTGHGSSPLLVPGLLASFLAGCALLAVNLIDAILRLLGHLPATWIEPWLRGMPGSLFFPTLLAVGAPALLAAPPPRRRRYRGAIALLLLILSLPAIAELAEVAERRTTLSLELESASWKPLLHLPLVLLPFILLVAIAPPPSRRNMHRWLKALFTPGLLLPLLGVWLTGFGLLLATRRELTVGELLSEPLALALVALSTATAVVLSLHREARRLVDHLLFPRLERMRRRLGRLPARLHGERSGAEISSVLADELRRGLGIERSTLLLASASGRQLVDVGATLPPLSSAGPLARRLATAKAALLVDLSVPAFSTLPPEERRWLATHRVELLVPLTAPDDTLLATLVVADRGDRWLDEERTLLSALLEVAAPVIDIASRRHQDSQATSEAGGRATECVDCHRLHPPSAAVCPRCEGLLSESDVPHTIPGRIRFEARIDPRGEYAMYRARDLSLARRVGVKAPARVTPELSIALRREARTLASVAHPHLETIYGIETWNGRPYLILELLETETIEDRLDRERRLSLRELLATGIAAADALATLHEAGVVHRSIQPGAVSWGRDGTVKLIDLHTARSIDDPRPASSSTRRSSSPSSSESELERWLREARHRPPESPERRASTPSADIWALHATLFHAFTGRPPYPAASAGELTDRTRRDPVPRISEVLAGVPAEIDEYFARALHRDPDRRIPDARTVAAVLSQLRDELFGSSAA